MDKSLIYDAAVAMILLVKIRVKEWTYDWKKLEDENQAWNEWV